jgi:DNA-binding CsgD family transcriptional regulator
MNHDLTKTQQEIVSLLVAGYTKPEILAELTCTSKSLDNWLRQIKQKHGFTTLRQIVNFYKV